MRSVFIMCAVLYIYIYMSISYYFLYFLLLSSDRNVLKFPVKFAGTKVFCEQMKSGSTALAILLVACEIYCFVR